MQINSTLVPRGSRYEIGLFYFVQPLPRIDPRVIKAGYTTNMKERLTSYRTLAPGARIIKTWRCPRVCERDAIRAIAAALAHSGATVRNEVFEFPDINEAVAVADVFFAGIESAMVRLPRRMIGAPSHPARREKKWRGYVSERSPGYFVGAITVAGKRYNVSGFGREMAERRLAEVRQRVLSEAIDQGIVPPDVL